MHTYIHYANILHSEFCHFSGRFLQKKSGQFGIGNIPTYALIQCIMYKCIFEHVDFSSDYLRTLFQQFFFNFSNQNPNGGFGFLHLVELFSCGYFHKFFDSCVSQTYIGAFVVAINPYKAIANYSTDTIQCYARSNYFKLPPHM